jgi:hypothetical protein
MGEHDGETTLTMLERKTAELRAAVNKAGWDSVAASHSPNAPHQRPRADGSRLKSAALSRGSLHAVCWATSYPHSPCQNAE